MPPARPVRGSLLEPESLDALHRAIRGARRAGRAVPPALAPGLRDAPPARVPPLRHLARHQARRPSGGAPLSRVDMAAVAAGLEAGSLDGRGSGRPVD